MRHHVTSVTKGGSQPHLLPRELIFELRELIPQHGLVCIRDRLYRRVGVRFSSTPSNNRAETNDSFVFSEELARKSLTTHLFGFGLLGAEQLVLLLDELSIAVLPASAQRDSGSQFTERERYERATHLFHLLHLVEQVGLFSLERGELVGVGFVRGESCSSASV